MLRNGLQPGHIIVLVLVILLVFGASKLPDIAGSIGKSLKVFKKEVKELREDDDDPGSSYTATGGRPPQGQTAYPPYDAQHGAPYPPPGNAGPAGPPYPPSTSHPAGQEPDPRSDTGQPYPPQGQSPHQS